MKKVQKSNKTFTKQKPILLKIAPDLNNLQLDEVIEIVAETKIDGVIASNTSLNRDGLIASKEQLEAIGNGGLSGKPICDRSTSVIKYLAEKSNRVKTSIGSVIILFSRKFDASISEYSYTIGSLIR